MSDRFKRWLQRLLIAWAKRLFDKTPPKPEQSGVVRALTQRLIDVQAEQESGRRDYIERCHELYEARMMQGDGPWHPFTAPTPQARMASLESFGRLTGADPVALRENAISAQGSMGDLELAIQNVEWRREVQLSWLEFSRWGIQQIILISRLYFTKNPVIRRALNVDAYYVFGRGVECASNDKAVDDAIKEFLEFNKTELGQTALTEHQKRTNYDGNLFFVFFPDKENTGQMPVRTIDATEIQDIITNPEDTTEEWFFRRTWTFRNFDPTNGQTMTHSGEAWYPALGYDPPAKPKDLAGKPIMWDQPVLHRKYGAVGKWLFGCPPIYPALDWAKAVRRYLEACATLAQSLAQISMSITTKGGQQALAGVKQQLETTVGPNTAIWDQNPTAVNASVFASGPGTTLAAFHSRGQGLDPGEVKQFVAMVAICMDLPPTFFGDLETANLATATTLDRPTELAFLEKQERWRELLVCILTYALQAQIKAPNGKLREALKAAGRDPEKISIVEAPRKVTRDASGRNYTVYMTEAERKAAGKPKKDDEIEITVNFPSIREGDIPALATALATAMTLGNKGGQIVGIDERAGVLKLMELFNIEGREDLVEEMYPSKGPHKYDPNRTEEDDAAALQPPISSRPPYSQGGPQAPGGHPQPAPKEPVAEAMRLLASAGQRLKRIAGKRAA